MEMSKWAEKEIEIACNREEKAAGEEDAWYGVTCYKSALKAFKALCDDDHSGLSISITQGILNRLIDGKPLTPIEDTDDIWNMCSRYEDKNCTVYQCSRMSSLFKDVYDDGRVEYHDIDRIVYSTSTGTTYSNGFIDRIANEYIDKITMPYNPSSKSIYVYADDYLYDPKNGDFDTIAIFYIKNPDGERIEVNRYFKWDDEVDTEWVEIDKETFDKRVEVHEQRLKETKEND